MAFGGQWGTGTSWNQTQFLYPASIVGVAEGNYTSAVAMPTGLSFRTGSTGDRLDGVNLNYGIERLRISSTGQATFTNTITAAQDFISSTTTAILATTGAGSIALRPNGAGSAAGQMSLAATGNATFFGPTSVIVRLKDRADSVPTNLTLAVPMMPTISLAMPRPANWYGWLARQIPLPFRPARPRFKGPRLPTMVLRLINT